MTNLYRRDIYVIPINREASILSAMPLAWNTFTPENFRDKIWFATQITLVLLFLAAYELIRIVDKFNQLL